MQDEGRFTASKAKANDTNDQVSTAIQCRHMLIPGRKAPNDLHGEDHFGKVCRRLTVLPDQSQRLGHDLTHLGQQSARRCYSGDGLQSPRWCSSQDDIKSAFMYVMFGILRRKLECQVFCQAQNRIAIPPRLLSTWHQVSLYTIDLCTHSFQRTCPFCTCTTLIVVTMVACIVVIDVTKAGAT